MLERGPIRAWIVDDTGLPKKGKLSVGVARQYCGQLGKRDNCQVAVTLSIANEAASLPIAYRLYLPESWANDPARRAMAGVPEEVVFRTKPEIALEQIGRAVADGVPRGVVVTDAGYGNDTGFRDGVTALELPYVAGIQGTTGLLVGARHRATAGRAAAGPGPAAEAAAPGHGPPAPFGRGAGAGPAC
jgi:SRSO17 transposase